MMLWSDLLGENHFVCLVLGGIASGGEYLKEAMKLVWWQKIVNKK